MAKTRPPYAEQFRLKLLELHVTAARSRSWRASSNRLSRPFAIGSRKKNAIEANARMA